jgi:hypothetical protein
MNGGKKSVATGDLLARGVREITSTRQLTAIDFQL